MMSLIVKTRRFLFDPAFKSEQKQKKAEFEAAYQTGVAFWRATDPEAKMSVGSYAWDWREPRSEGGRERLEMSEAVMKGVCAALAVRALALESDQSDPFDGARNWSDLANALYTARPGSPLWEAGRLAGLALTPDHAYVKGAYGQWKAMARGDSLDSPDRSFESYLDQTSAARAAIQRLALNRVLSAPSAPSEGACARPKSKRL